MPVWCGSYAEVLRHLRQEEEHCERLLQRLVPGPSDRRADLERQLQGLRDAAAEYEHWAEREEEIGHAAAQAERVAEIERHGAAAAENA